MKTPEKYEGGETLHTRREVLNHRQGGCGGMLVLSAWAINRLGIGRDCGGTLVVWMWTMDSFGNGRGCGGILCICIWIENVGFRLGVGGTVVLSAWTMVSFGIGLGWGGIVVVCTWTIESFGFREGCGGTLHWGRMATDKSWLFLSRYLVNLLTLRRILAGLLWHMMQNRQMAEMQLSRRSTLARD